MKKITISNSKREAGNCLHYFKKKYLDRTRVPKNVNLEEGTFLHDVANIYTRQLIKNKLQSDDNLLDLVVGELWKAQNVLPENYYDSLYQVVRQFGERFQVNLKTIWGSELGIAFDYDLNQVDFPNLASYEAEDQYCQDNDIWIHQRLDRVDIDESGRVAYITDYKSARAVTSKSDLERRGQGRQYAWALMQINPYLEKVYVTFDFIRYKNAQVTLEYDRESVSHVPHMLKIFTQKINERVENGGPWPATQSEMCELCSYGCPLNDPSLSIPAVINDDDTAVKLAQKLYAMGRESKQIKDKLKVYTKNRAPIDINIGEYGYATNVSFGLGAKKMVELCQKYNLDIDDFLTIDTVKAKKNFVKIDLDVNASRDFEAMTKDDKGKSTRVTTTRFSFKEKIKMENEEGVDE